MTIMVLSLATDQAIPAVPQGRAPAAPQTSTPPAQGATSGAASDAGTCMLHGVPVTDPHAQYNAAVAQRDELVKQQARLDNKRLPIADRLRQGNAATGADLDGLTARITQLDKSIIEVVGKLQGAEADVATIAACPYAVPAPRGPSNGPPEGAIIISVFMIMFVFFPISLSIAKRMWRRGAVAAAAIPKDIADRLSRIEDSVDSIAIELERVGEGQRFVTNMLVETGPHMLGAGGMEPVAVPERQAEEVRRE